MNCALPASTQGTVWANSQAPEAPEVGVWNRLSWTGCSTCLFPVHRGLHVTTRFGRLTGFLALRVSFSKHEGTNSGEEREDSTQESASLAASLRMVPPVEIYTEWWGQHSGRGTMRQPLRMEDGRCLSAALASRKPIFMTQGFKFSKSL